jgi:hypothetical protein
MTLTLRWTVKFLKEQHQPCHFPQRICDNIDWKYATYAGPNGTRHPTPSVICNSSGDHLCGSEYSRRPSTDRSYICTIRLLILALFKFHPSAAEIRRFAEPRHCGFTGRHSKPRSRHVTGDLSRQSAARIVSRRCQLPEGYYVACAPCTNEP